MKQHCFLPLLECHSNKVLHVLVSVSTSHPMSASRNSGWHLLCHIDRAFSVLFFYIVLFVSLVTTYSYRDQPAKQPHYYTIAIEVCCSFRRFSKSRICTCAPVWKTCTGTRNSIAKISFVFKRLQLGNGNFYFVLYFSNGGQRACFHRHWLCRMPQLILVILHFMSNLVAKVKVW